MNRNAFDQVLNTPLEEVMSFIESRKAQEKS